MHKGYAFVQFTNPFDARSACMGEDGRSVFGQILGEYDTGSSSSTLASLVAATHTLAAWQSPLPRHKSSWLLPHTHLLAGWLARRPPRAPLDSFALAVAAAARGPRAGLGLGVGRQAVCRAGGGEGPWLCACGRVSRETRWDEVAVLALFSPIYLGCQYRGRDDTQDIERVIFGAQSFFQVAHKDRPITKLEFKETKAEEEEEEEKKDG